MGRVKVVLRQDVPKVGEAGAVATVAAGFARNYLIPRGLAIPATKGALRDSQAVRNVREGRANREKAGAEEIRSKLESGPLPVKSSAGPDGRLFGSITAPQIVDSVRDNLQVTIDRYDVQLDEPIRHLGFHEVKVKLHPQVTATVILEVGEE